MTKRHHWQDWVFFVVGLWLIVSPWVFDHTAGSAFWSIVALGALVVVLAIAGLVERGAQEGTDFAVAVVAVLVVAAPWMLGFTGTDPASAWNAGLSGTVLAVAALWTHLIPHEGGHA